MYHELQGQMQKTSKDTVDIAGSLTSCSSPGWPYLISISYHLMSDECLWSEHFRLACIFLVFPTHSAHLPENYGLFLLLLIVYHPHRSLTIGTVMFYSQMLSESLPCFDPCRMPKQSGTAQCPYLPKQLIRDPHIYVKYIPLSKSCASVLGLLHMICNSNSYYHSRPTYW